MELVTKGAFSMNRFLLWLFALMLLAAGPAWAQPQAFPAGFKTIEIATNGTTLHVRTGGSGPAVVLLHGYGETGDMWGAMAADLARDHTVVVPDLRGYGRSDKPEGDASHLTYSKRAMALDQIAIMRALG
ncbi:MAG: alpha/beta fold hydrolase, partial [Caulobacter sp.]